MPVRGYHYLAQLTITPSFTFPWLAAIASFVIFVVKVAIVKTVLSKQRFRPIVFTVRQFELVATVEQSAPFELLQLLIATIGQSAIFKLLSVFIIPEVVAIVIFEVATITSFITKS